jgi:TonB family protein
MLAEGSASGEGAGRALEVGGATAAAPTAPPDVAQSSPAPAPASGTVVLGKLKVTGALSAAQVSGPLGQAGRGCRGTLAGKVTLRFDIDRTGKVTNVRLSGSPKVVSPISACVTQAVRTLSFPAAESGTTAVEREIEVSLSR